MLNDVLRNPDPTAEDNDSLEGGETAMSGEQDFWLRLVAAPATLPGLCHRVTDWEALPFLFLNK